MQPKFPIRATDGSTTVDITQIEVPESAISVNSTSIDLGLPNVTFLATDVTNNNVSANTIADVTGLSFSVTAGKLYYFEFCIMFTAAATTTGSRWAINGPTSPTVLSYTSEYSLTATTSTRNANVVAYDSPAAASATSGATAGNQASIYGFIQPSASGTVTARFASEVSNSAIVAKTGSFVTWRQLT